MVNRLENGELLMKMAIKYTIHTPHRGLVPCAMMEQKARQLGGEHAHGTEVWHNGSIKA